MGRAVLLHRLEEVARTVIQAMAGAGVAEAAGGPRIATRTAAAVVAVVAVVVAAQAVLVDNPAAALLLFIFSPQMHALNFAPLLQATAVTAEMEAMEAREEFTGLVEAVGLTAGVANRTMAAMALLVATVGMAGAAGTAAAVRAGPRLEFCVRVVQVRNSRRSVSHSVPAALGAARLGMQDRMGRFQMFIREMG